MAAVVVAVLVLSGCTTPDNSPDDYGEQARTRFVDACTGDVLAEAEDEDDRTTDVLLPPESTCTCIYEWFADPDNGVDYDEFESLDGDAESDPGAVPAELQLALDACGSAPVAPPVTAEG